MIKLPQIIKDERGRPAFAVLPINDYFEISGLTLEDIG